MVDERFLVCSGALVGLLCCLLLYFYVCRFVVLGYILGGLLLLLDCW